MRVSVGMGAISFRFLTKYKTTDKVVGVGVLPNTAKISKQKLERCKELK